MLPFWFGLKISENICHTAGGLFILALFPIKIPEPLTGLPHWAIFIIVHLKIHGFLKCLLISVHELEEKHTSSS